MGEIIATVPQLVLQTVNTNIPALVTEYCDLLKGKGVDVENNHEIKKNVLAAIMFMKSHGFANDDAATKKNIFDNMNGIDFTKLVEVKIIPADTKLYSMQVAGYATGEVR